ncbi:acyltransferase family protein [Nocardioides ferulae]|uniref:acyltransferase family protein n=1 Tax=Nocardioides ferulae TaxID=2340821 RepID=UPI000EB222D5|nr:acyltransferase family protein [Nocardioides ferulae]
MTWTYRPSLDGLRMLSMYLIVLFHAGVPWLRGSFVAVDLFFVLSGFLVTQVILEELERTGRLSLRRFYARRVRRLLPAALVAIVGTSLVFLLVASAVRRAAVVGDAQAALLYVANWGYIAEAEDYFAVGDDPSPFLHYWTLSIEEQFYILFPLVVLLLVRTGRRWALPAGLAGLFVLSVAAQTYWGFVDPIHAYYGTDARAYQLLAGALLALAFRRLAATGRSIPRPWAVALASGGLVVFLALTPTSLVTVSQSARGFVATAAILAMIAGLMAAERQPLGRLLARPLPVYLGKITYATYLWHWPLVLVLAQILVVRPEVLAVLVAVLATALAAASNELVELPVRRARRLDAFAWPVVAVGVAGCLVAAAVVVPRILESDRRPVLAASRQTASEVDATLVADEAERQRTGRAGAGGVRARLQRERPPKNVDWKAVEEDTGFSVKCTRDDVRDCVVARGAGRHVVVVGDSHAMMLSEAFEALAEEHDWTLSMNVVASCPWQEGLRNAKFGETLQAQCERARVGWYDEVLPELDPDVVVLIARPRDGQDWARHVTRRDSREQSLERATLRATRDTVEKVRAAGAEAVLVKQIAMAESWDPLECLAEAERLVECVVAMPSEPAVSNGFFDSLAADLDGVHSVDLNQALFPDFPVAAPVVDGEIVWADQAHVTATYAHARRDHLWRTLRKAGAFG